MRDFLFFRETFLRGKIGSLCLVSDARQKTYAKPCSQPQTGVAFLLIPPRRTPSFFPEQIESEVHTMPVNKEFTFD